MLAVTSHACGFEMTYGNSLEYLIFAVYNKIMKLPEGRMVLE